MSTGVRRMSVSWRVGVLLAFASISLVALLLLPPITQDQSYHQFADRRAWHGIANFLDVASNLAFLIVGLLGLRAVRHHRDDPAAPAWVVLFAGVILVSAGSAWYHLAPDDGSLLWDRLPMTVGFMGLLAALVGEFVAPRASTRLLAPAVLAGMASAIYWHVTGDLRFYAWIQFMPLGVLLLLFVLFEPRYSHGWLFPVALGWYVVAKILEYFDLAVYEATAGAVGGHTLKHLAAAAACYTLVVYLERRRLLAPG